MEREHESPGSSIMEVIGILAQSMVNQQNAVLNPLQSRHILHFLYWSTAMMKNSLVNLETASERLGALRGVLANLLEIFDDPQPLHSLAEWGGLELCGLPKQGADEAPHDKSEG